MMIDRIYYGNVIESNAILLFEINGKSPKLFIFCTTGKPIPMQMMDLVDTYTFDEIRIVETCL